MYSIKDVLVKANNKFGGKVNSKIWRVLSKREKESIQYGEIKGRCVDDELIPPEPIYIKVTNTMVVVANDKVVDGMDCIAAVIPTDVEDIIGYGITDCRYWVYSVYHFEGIWILWGYSTKGEALKKVMAEKRNSKVFEVVFFQMTDGKYIGVPTAEEFYYPVEDYLNKRFSEYLHYTGNPICFDRWVVDYLNSLINGFIRDNPEESQEWYELRKELTEYKAEFANKGKINYKTIFSIYDKALQYQYGGIDINDLF